jgi:lysophospholipase L1-like esterase
MDLVRGSRPAAARARAAIVAVALLLFFLSASLRGSAQEHWVGSWAAAQQLMEPDNRLPPEDLEDATLRQIVHLSIGGNILRIHMSNAFGTAPLHLNSVHIARAQSPAESAIDPASDKLVTFSGRSDATIPPGAEYWSDPVALGVPALSDVAISIHYDHAPAGQTGHPGSRATSYYMHGNAVSTRTLPNAHTLEHWYQLSEVDVGASDGSKAVVALGDSITDGHGTTTNGNDRWTDILARRLQSSPCTADIGMLNVGIGGNRVLLDQLGPNALARFDRDVLARPGVSFLILLEGVNDLGMLTRDGEVSAARHQALVQELIGAYQQIVERAHARGVVVIGGTLSPYGNSNYYHPGPLSEDDRQALNTWIRTPGHFDAVVDFDKLLADPSHPAQLLPAYDSGDHLHPSLAGYRAMAQAVPLTLFANCAEQARAK